MVQQIKSSVRNGIPMLRTHRNADWLRWLLCDCSDWKMETGVIQGKPRQISRIRELWVQMRDLASMNKWESINLRPPYIGRYTCTYT